MKSMIIFSPIMLLFLLAQSSCRKDCNKSSNCDLEYDSGSCKAYFPKYYFDKDEGKCKEFIWGGCEGTVPFESLEECKDCECTD